MMIRLLVFSFSLMFLSGCSGGANTSPNVTSNQAIATKQQTVVPVYGYEVVNKFPHDRNAFTQGLIFHDGFLYESTGQVGATTVRQIELKTGRVIKRYDVPKPYFGEGLTILNDKIYQLTWRENTAFVYDMDLKLEREFRYAGEGWGLTHDGTNLLMSDGTHIIRIVDPNNFETLRTIAVQRPDGRPQMKLNELEFVKGEIWANIWHSEEPETLGKPNYIARIDPANGKVIGWIDLGGISPDDQKRDRENTLNGIAYDAANDRIFVTGKNWANLYEIKLTAPKGQ